MLFNALLLVFAIFLCVYLFFKYKFSYWARKNVPYDEPSFPLGNVVLPGKNKDHIIVQFDEMYKRGKAKGAKVYGLYTITQPNVLIIDNHVMKRILVKDFNNFHDRGFPYDEENDPLSAHLLSLEGEKWKNLRNRFSPAFTSGKLKSMFSTLADCTKGLRSCFEESISKGEPIEMKDILARYTTDVIGSCAFGVEVNSLDNPDCDFRKYGKRIFEQSFISQLKNSFIFAFPEFSKKLKLRQFPEDMSNFFIGLVREVVSLRKSKSLKRNDIMQNVIELMDKGRMEGDTVEPGKKLTLHEAAAQAFVFFIGGFDTSSSAMAFALYELSRNLEIQERAREEIIDVLKRHKFEYTYESINEMRFLECIISETLRLYPSVAVSTRKAHEDYFIPEINATLKKGTIALILIYSLHHDPDYFPNPEKFDPDRFSPENEASIQEFTYLPFGDGPRNCIGKRFGMLQMKVCLASLLSNYKFTLNPKTKTPMKFNPYIGNLAVDGGLWLDAQKV